MELPKTILEDSRNQAGKHLNIHNYCGEQGIRIVRTKLVCGDYTLPTDQSICIDTKQGMQEVYGNMVQAHDRFRRECDLARELGIHLVILVEDNEVESIDTVHLWENPRVRRYLILEEGHKVGRFLGTKLPDRKPIDSERLERMMKTFAEHHGCEWRFCRKEDTGRTVCEILMGGIA